MLTINHVESIINLLDRVKVKDKIDYSVKFKNHQICFSFSLFNLKQ